MPRPRSAITTALGRALVEKRAARSLDAVGQELGVTFATLSRLERGTHRPSYDTAVKLAAWLGWSTDEVMAAAGQAVGGSNG